MGIGSDNCIPVLNDPNLNMAIGAFFGQNAQCNLNIEVDVFQLPHFYSTCTCDQLQSATSNGYILSGYKFNPSNGPLFTADYPTSSPWVTSVGATQFLSDDGKTISQEITCSILSGALITTGGGFSSFQTMPSYQQSAVASYLQQPDVQMPPSYSYDPTMRAYPDVTFCGHHYKIFFSNSTTDNCPCLPTVVDGTSASSPAFAGLISLINDQLLNAGKSELGFLNILLYQMAAEQSNTFNDVTVGTNRCTRAECCTYGWQTGTGWDPVTGLGSPNFENMLQYILKKKGVIKS
jgi:subtilase family serine protease